MIMHFEGSILTKSLLVRYIVIHNKNITSQKNPNVYVNNHKTHVYDPSMQNRDSRATAIYLLLIIHMFVIES